VKLACTHLGLVPGAVAPWRTRAIITTTIPPSSSSCGPHAGVACRRHHTSKHPSRHASWLMRMADAPAPVASLHASHHARSLCSLAPGSKTAPELTKAVTIPAPKLLLLPPSRCSWNPSRGKPARTRHGSDEVGIPHPYAAWAADAARCGCTARHARAARLKF
jgi:hypothetical protein